MENRFQCRRRLAANNALNALYDSFCRNRTISRNVLGSYVGYSSMSRDGQSQLSILCVVLILAHVSVVNQCRDACKVQSGAFWGSKKKIATELNIRNLFIASFSLCSIL